MAKEKTISQKLRELADWLDKYEKWYNEYLKKKEFSAQEDEGGQPGGPPPPPPPPTGGFGNP